MRPGYQRSSAFVRGKDFLPAALAPRVRRVVWICGYERVHGGDVPVRGQEPASAEAGSGKRPGSRFKGSTRNGLNSAVGPGFAVGSPFKGSVRNGLDGATGPGVGAPCDGRTAGPRRPAVRAASSRSRRLPPVLDAIRTNAGAGGLNAKLVSTARVWPSSAGAQAAHWAERAAIRAARWAARSMGAAGVRAACGIARVSAVYLTDTMGISNRSGKEPHSAATARSPPWRISRQRPGLRRFRPDLPSPDCPACKPAGEKWPPGGQQVDSGGAAASLVAVGQCPAASPRAAYNRMLGGQACMITVRSA
jgi:hypothetical protein